MDDDLAQHLHERWPQMAPAIQSWKVYRLHEWLTCLFHKPQENWRQNAAELLGEPLGLSGCDDFLLFISLSVFSLSS
jgi:hypothetical protein